jgi:hypothetical protein
MPAQILTQVDPQQFFRLPSTNATAGQRLDTKVSGVTVSNFSDRLSVTTAEGGTITLSADLESDFRAVNYTTEDDGQAVDIRKAANIFKQYVSGEDEEALAKAAKLAERFGHLVIALRCGPQCGGGTVESSYASGRPATADNWHDIWHSYPGWGAFDGCGDPAIVHRYLGAHPALD